MVFDLFFNPKGRLDHHSYIIPKVITVILMSCIATVVAKTPYNKMFIGPITYIEMYFFLYLLMVYSTAIIDIKRVRDMGHSIGFGIIGTFLFLMPKIHPLVNTIFNFIMFFYYFWLGYQPSVNGLTKGEEREIFKKIQKELNEKGEEAFKKEIIETAPEVIKKARALLRNPDLPADERAILKGILENAEKSYNEFKAEMEEGAEKEE